MKTTKTWKRITAGILAFALIGGIAPTNTGLSKLFNNTAIAASAANIGTYTADNNTYTIHDSYVNIKDCKSGDIIMSGSTLAISGYDEYYISQRNSDGSLTALYRSDGTYYLNHSVQVEGYHISDDGHEELIITPSLAPTVGTVVTEFTDESGTHNIFSGGIVKIDQIDLGDVILSGTTILNDGYGWFLNKDTWSLWDTSKPENGAFVDLAWTHKSYTFDFDAKVVFRSTDFTSPTRCDIIVASNAVALDSAVVSDGLVYNGEAQFPTFTAGETELTKDVDFAVVSGDDSQTSAGSYSTTISAKNNDKNYNTYGVNGANCRYYGSKTFNWDIDHLYTRHKAVAATCTTDGRMEYYTDENNNFYTNKGKPLTDRNGDGKINIEDTVIKATGHIYGKHVWKWSDDYSSASAFFPCTNCRCAEEVDAVVTTKTMDPTYTREGKTIYTATVEFEGKAYTDTKTIIIDKLPYTAPKITWQEGGGAVKLTWNEIEGAEKYAVYEYTDGKWKALGQGAGTSFVIKNLEAGTKHKIAVVAKIGSEWVNDVSNAVIVTTKAKITKNPTISYQAGEGSVKLTWNAVDGAEKYGIAGYVSGSWRLLDEGYGTSYVLNGLKAGNKYKVAVIAKIGGKWKKDFSNAAVVSPKEKSKTDKS